MEQRKTFKERWNETDELCPACGHVVKEAKGLNKQNLKKLFRKPTYIDVMLFIILLLTLAGSYAYYHETISCRSLVENPAELCAFYYSNIAHGNFGDEIDQYPLNISIPWQNP